MRKEPVPESYPDDLSTYDMLIRWQIAAEHLAGIETDGQLADVAIRTLVNRDFPLLLSEVKRMRPEIWGIEILVRAAEVPSVHRND